MEPDTGRGGPKAAPVQERLKGAPPPSPSGLFQMAPNILKQSFLLRDWMDPLREPLWC